MVRFWLRKLARQFRRSTPVAGKATGQKRGSRPAPRLELLEDRITPSTLDFVGGVLSYTASSGVVNNFTLSLSGSTYTLNDTGETITLTAAAKAAGYTGSGTNTVTGPNSSALTSITVNLGDLADTANIRSTAKPTLVNTGDGNDTINVSSTGLTGNLAGITAPLTIDAGAGANILNVSDYTATSGNQNVVIGSTSITGFAGPTDNVAINYQATGGTFSLLHVLGSNTPSLSQTFTVNNPNTSLLQLNTDNGTNTVNVQAISGPVSIVGGLGKDNIVVCSTSDLSGSLDNINGALTIDGGQGVNTLTVSDAGTTGPANNAVITSSQITGFAGANNDQTISYKAIGGTFSQIHLIGASDASLADQFTLSSPNGPLVLDAGAGNNIVNVRALTSAATINGNGGDDTINVSSDAPTNQGVLNNINGTLTVDGGSGTNTLFVSDYGQTSLTDNVTVTPTTITGFAGSSKATTINYGAGTFSSVVLSGSNTLADTFTVSGSTNVSLLGNGGNDTFKLSDGATAQSIDGGAGTDTLSYSAYTTNVNVTLAASSSANGYQSNSATGLSSGFANIDALVAGSGTNNTLTGEDVASTWTLGSSAQTYNDGGSTSLAFSGFQTLDGGSDVDIFNINANATIDLNGNGGNDTFNVADGVTLTGTIDGGAGTDTLSYAAYSSPVAVTLTGSDATGFSSTSATGVTQFAGIDNLIGGQGSDALTGENVASTWTLGSTNSYNDTTATLTFSAFETVDGGTDVDTFNVAGSTDVTTANGNDGADIFNVNANATVDLNGNGGNDTFNVADGVTLTGTIDGGAGTDTLSYAAYSSPVAVTLTGSDATGFSSTSATGVTQFAGIDNLVGGTASDSLTGEDVASTWTLGSTNSYNDTTATLTFSAFETVDGGTDVDTFNVAGSTDVTTANGNDGADIFNVNANATIDLNGNSGNDTFNLADGVTLTGTIDGGAGTDTLSYAAYSSPVAVTLTGSDATGFSSTSATGVTQFAGIDNLVGGTASDSLTGEDVASTWTLGASPNTYSDGTATLAFSAFETVNAGSAGDEFDLQSGASGYTINGGAGTDTLTGIVDPTLTGSGSSNGYGGTADNAISFTAIDVLTGSGTFTGDNNDSTFTINSTSTYNDGATSNSLSLSGFDTIAGGTGDDVFTIVVAGSSTVATLGTLDGGDGTNTLNATNVNVAQQIADGYNYTNFQIINANGTFFGPNTDTTYEWNGTVWLMNGTSIGTPSTIKAGTANDTFIVDAGTTTTTNMLGGDGDDSFTIGSGAQALGAVDGGTGTNTLNIPGSVTLTGSADSGSEVGYAGTNANLGTNGFVGISILSDTNTTPDSLTGEDVASTWTLGSSAQTYNDGGSTSLTFSGYQTLDAGTAGDTFNINANTTVDLNGNVGNDTFNVADGVTLTGTIDGGAGTDTLSYAAYSSPVAVTLTGSDATGFSSTSATGLSQFKGIDNLVGGTASDTLTGENVASTWTLGSPNSYNDATATLAFSAFETVDGGTDVDTFNVTGSGDVTTANGGDGADIFNINANTTVDLNGNGGNDTFNVADGVTLTGTIDGGAGTDTLSYAAYSSPVAVTLTGSDATGFSSTSATGVTQFAGIDNLIGGQGSDALTGENVASTWTLGSTNSYNDGSNPLAFSSFETANGGPAVDTFNVAGSTDVTTANGNNGNDIFNVNANATVDLNGNGGNDTFNVADGVTLTGTIDGGAGTDTLSYAAYSSPVAVTLTGSDATGFSSTSATGVTQFAGIDNLVGGTASDTLTGENVASTWTLGSTQTYNDGSNNLAFSAFETVDGGTDVDTFNVTGSGDVTTANGGDGNDIFNINANATIDLNGNGGNDTFNVAATVTLTGTVDGGAGTDTLSYAAYNASVAITLASSDATGFTSLASPGITQFKGIDNLIGGQGSDALTGENVASTWTLGSPNSYNDATATLAFSAFETVDGGTDVDTFNVAGSTDVTTANGNDGADIFNVNANATVDLNGNGGNDTFNLADGVTLTGTIDGGAGTDTLSYAAYSNPVAVTLTGSDATGFSSTSATGVTQFAGIDNLVGGTASDSLTGEDVASTWTLGASPNTYSDGIATLAFSAFETVNAGSAGDEFDLQSGASGYTINGGAGTDTLTGIVDPTLTGSGSSNGYGGTADNAISFTAIDVLTGSGTFTGDNNDSTFTINSTSTYNDGATSNSLSLSGFDTIAGGTGDDVFTIVVAGSSTVATLGTLDGGDGTNTLNATNVNVAQQIADGYNYTNFQIINANGTFLGANTDTTYEWNGTVWLMNGTSIGTPSTIKAGTANDTFIVDAGTTTTTNMLGGDGDDSFTIGSGAQALGAVDGGTGTNTLNIPGSVTLTGSADSGSEVGYAGTNANLGTNGFVGISILSDTNTTPDSLTGEDVASTWTLGSSAQTYNDGGSTSLTFSGYQTLDAGTAGDTFNINANTTVDLNGNVGNDTFNVADGVTLTGTIDGGAGTDTLSYAAYSSPVAVTLTGSDATGFSSTSATGVSQFAGIDNLVGGTASDTLTGEDVASTWTLGGSSQGYNDGNAALTFSSFETANGGSAVDTFNVAGSTDVTAANGNNGNDIFNVNANATVNLNGNAGNDTFNLADGVTLTGTIDGGAGTDTLSYAAYSSAVAVTLTGSDATGFSSTSATGLSQFKGIDNLIGGQGSDALTGENVASTWTLGSTNSYNDGSNPLAFSSFETANGGSAVDTFNVAGSTDVTTANGNNGNDIFNVNANATVNLNGNAGNDTFNLADGVTLTGTADGGTGMDTLSYAAYTTGVSVVLSSSTATTGFTSSSATGLTGFAGIDVLTGGQGTDTLTGENKASTWDVGTTQDYRDGTASLTFSAIEQLQGGTAADVFNITSGSTPVTLVDGGDGNDTFNLSANATMNLSGGMGDDLFKLADGVVLTGTIDGGAGTDTLNYTKYTTDVSVVLTSSDATGYASSTGSTGVSSFQGIDVIVGGMGANDTLTGENVDSTWTVGDTQTYDDGAGNGTLAFSAFETLSGGTGDDVFNVTKTTSALTLLGNDGDDVFTVSNLAAVQGNVTIDGGTGDNILGVDDSANQTSVGWVIDATTIQQFNAGLITFGNIANVTVTTGTPTDSFSNALDIEGVGPTTSLTIQASQTDVTVAQVAQNLAGIQGSLVIDAIGSNVTITVNDSMNTADTNYFINGLTGSISTDTVSILVLEAPTSVVVLGGSGTNSFDVTPSAVYPISVDGGSGGNSTLTYHTGGSTTWTDTGSSIIDPTLVDAVFYSNFKTVIVTD